VSRLLRFFPPVVTGTIIAIIGISLMRVGIGWAMGGPPNLAQTVDVAKLATMVDAARASAAAAGASAAPLRLSGPVPMLDSAGYAALDNMAISAFVLAVILLISRYARGFLANISVLIGIVAGCVLAAALGKMSFAKVGQAHWVDVVTPFVIRQGDTPDARLALKITEGTSNFACAPSTSSTCFSTLAAERIVVLKRTLARRSGTLLCSTVSCRERPKVTSPSPKVLCEVWTLLASTVRSTS